MEEGEFACSTLLTRSGKFSIVGFSRVSSNSTVWISSSIVRVVLAMTCSTCYIPATEAILNLSSMGV